MQAWWLVVRPWVWRAVAICVRSVFFLQQARGDDAGGFPRVRVGPNGFRPSNNGMLGPGVYVSQDINKARAYGELAMAPSSR